MLFCFVFSSIVNAEAARRFCEHHDCPISWKDADGENCCIHHANIHSCPLGYMVYPLDPIIMFSIKSEDKLSSNVQNESNPQTLETICGPWIPDDGKIFTHTISTSGKMTQTNWTAKVTLTQLRTGFISGLKSSLCHRRV